MGHYYSDLCCDNCGGLPCHCPDLRVGKFTIMNDYSIQKYYGTFRGDRHRQATSDYFDTVEEAKAAIPSVVQRSIEKIQEDIAKKNAEILELGRMLETGGYHTTACSRF